MPRLRITIEVREDVPAGALIWLIQQIVTTVSHVTPHATIGFDPVDNGYDHPGP